jgi:hypothetical protein
MLKGEKKVVKVEFGRKYLKEESFKVVVEVWNIKITELFLKLVYLFLLFFFFLFFFFYFILFFYFYLFFFIFN